MKNMQRRLAGFTLVELMVVVAVIGILAMIAYPSYVDHVRKSRRSLAKAALMEAAQKQEAYYARNTTYTDDLTDLGYASDPVDIKSDGGVVYYELVGNQTNIATATGNKGCALTSCYALTVRAKGDQLNDEYTRFRLWADGSKEYKKQSGNWTLGWPD